jgi:hypothetical protein
MTERSRNYMPEWAWWREAECVVKIVGIGHFPTTVMAQLPDDRVVEIDMNQLENVKGE